MKRSLSAESLANSRARQQDAVDVAQELHDTVLAALSVADDAFSDAHSYDSSGGDDNVSDGEWMEYMNLAKGASGQISASMRKVAMRRQLGALQSLLGEQRDANERLRAQSTVPPTPPFNADAKDYRKGNDEDLLEIYSEASVSGRADHESDRSMQSERKRLPSKQRRQQQQQQRHHRSSNSLSESSTASSRRAMRRRGMDNDLDDDMDERLRRHHHRRRRHGGSSDNDEDNDDDDNDDNDSKLPAQDRKPSGNNNNDSTNGGQ